MNDEWVDGFAGALIDAEHTRVPVPSSPDERLRSLDEAYATQERVLETRGATPVGWKVGATNAIAQRRFGFDEPFCGRVLRSGLHQSPARLPAESFFLRGLETEFAFRIGSDLRPRQAGHTEAQVRAAIDAVLPAIEIVDSRLGSWPAAPPFELVADNGAHGALVVGRPTLDWRDLDLPGHVARLEHNGAHFTEGPGANVLGDPLASVVWLANHLSARGLPLASGEIVTTGCVADVAWADVGDTAVASFGALGEVRLSFT